MANFTCRRQEYRDASLLVSACTSVEAIQESSIKSERVLMSSTTMTQSKPILAVMDNGSILVFERGGCSDQAGISSTG